MSNKIYDEEFYNEDQKERYLKGLLDNTYQVYSRILKRASLIEEPLKKDLYNFNLFEIGQLMKLLSPTTFLSSHSQLSNIRKYIDWGIKEDLRQDNINPLAVTITDEFVQSFVDTSNKYLFTDKEIVSIVGRITNFQDSALIQSLFEGIMGRAYSEILNMLKTDLSPEINVITVRNKPASGPIVERQTGVSDKLMGLLLAAARQDIYHSNNGTTESHLGQRKLIDTPYVFRPTVAHTKHFDVAEKTLVSRRIAMISKWFEYPYLTPINLRKSGMVRYAKELLDQTGKFEREEIVTVCKKFDLEYKVTTRLTKEFLNIETIESLYGRSDQEQV
jgi:hypothetical protein